MTTSISKYPFSSPDLQNPSPTPSTTSQIVYIVPGTPVVYPDGSLYSYNPLEVENHTLKEDLQKSSEKIKILETRLEDALKAAQHSRKKFLKSEVELSKNEEMNPSLNQKVKQVKQTRSALKHYRKELSAREWALSNSEAMNEVLKQKLEQVNKNYEELQAKNKRENLIYKKDKLMIKKLSAKIDSLQKKENKSQEQQIWKAKTVSILPSSVNASNIVLEKI